MRKKYILAQAIFCCQRLCWKPRPHRTTDRVEVNDHLICFGNGLALKMIFADDVPRRIQVGGLQYRRLPFGSRASTDRNGRIRSVPNASMPHRLTPMTLPLIATASKLAPTTSWPEQMRSMWMARHLDDGPRLADWISICYIVHGLEFGTFPVRV